MPCSDAVKSVLAGGLPGRVPSGEFYLEPHLARRLLLGKPLDSLEPVDGHERHDAQVEDTVLAAEMLGLDYLCVHTSPRPGDYWRGPCKDDIAGLIRRGFFVFGFVDGGFGRLCREWGFERTLAFAANRPDETMTLVLGLASERAEEARRVLDLGAGAIMLGEDFAYERGLLLHERLIAQIIFPEIEYWAKTLGAPVVLHCDGDISRIAPSLPETGVAGLHSLEHAVDGRLDIYAALGRRGMVLMGGVPHPALQGDATRAADLAHEIITACEGLPYVFGSSAGVLDEGLDPSAVRAAYSTLRAHAAGR